MTAMPRVLIDREPEIDFEERLMQFRLTYANQLLGASRDNRRTKHKHEIRQCFHPQLKRLWEVTPHLKLGRTTFNEPQLWADEPLIKHSIDALADRFQLVGYQFVPLITEELGLLCEINVLMLRPEPPGGVITSGDIDARLKTLFDALTMPTGKDQLGGYDTPRDGEEPFFCLLQNDKLISKIAVETDVLLENVKRENGHEENDVRLVITVRTRPVELSLSNLRFG